MAPVRFQPFISPCSSWKDASAEITARSPTLFPNPHCWLHFAKHPRKKSSGSHHHRLTPLRPPLLLLAVDVADASSALRGVPDCTAIVQIQNQGSRCNRCFDSQRLFYAVLSFPSSTALFVLICKKRNGDLLNNWRVGEIIQWFLTCVLVRKNKREAKLQHFDLN